MMYIGKSVLSKTKSQDILKPYSCSDQNKMASGISTQLAADSSVLWSLPNEACISEGKDFLSASFC